MKIKGCFGLVLVLLMSCCLFGQEIPFIDALHPPDEKDITGSTHFRFRPILSYADMY